MTGPDRTLPGTLYALALRITGGAGEAEGIVEQTLLEARGAATPEVGSFTRLARRCRILALVRSGRRTVESVRRPPVPSPRPAHPTDEPPGTRAGTETPASGDRRALELAYFDGYALAEIAALTKRSSSRVATTLARALGAFRPAPFVATAAPPGPRIPAADAERCALYALDMMEGHEREEFERRLGTGEPALLAELAACERAASRVALTAPAGTPPSDLAVRVGWA